MWTKGNEQGFLHKEPSALEITVPALDGNTLRCWQDIGVNRHNAHIKPFGEKLVKIFRALKESRPFQEQIPLLGHWRNTYSKLRSYFLIEGVTFTTDCRRSSLWGLPNPLWPCWTSLHCESQNHFQAKGGKSAGNTLFKNFTTESE